MKFPSNRAGAYRVRSVPVCALTHQSLAAQISGYAVHVAQPGRSAFKRRLDIGFESAPQTRPAARSSVSAIDAGLGQGRGLTAQPACRRPKCRISSLRTG